MAVTATGSIRGEKPAPRISKSQLRDPKFLEMATREIVEIITGGDDDVVMLPRQFLVEMERVQHLCEMFVRLTTTAEMPHIPRVLLGEAAFVADLPSLDRKRFLSEFAEAIGESLSTRDPKPAEFLLSAYRHATNVTNTDNPMFSGAVEADAEEAFAAHVASS
jgi:hypothetical protein